MTAARAGDPAAFAALVERNRSRVEAVAERLVGEDAEDLVQEALLRAYLGLTQLRDPARFGAWLCGIAVNLAKMRLRRRAFETRLLSEPAPDDGLEEREVLQRVREAVEFLPPGQRDVVVMHYLEGLSCDEIAALLGSSSGAVRVRLHRARQQLREQLAALAPIPAPKEVIHMIEVKLEDVLVRVAEDDPTTPVTDQRIVVLKESDGERLLPIWIGPAEGNALALRLTGETTPRPVTSDVMAELVRVTGARVASASPSQVCARTPSTPSSPWQSTATSTNSMPAQVTRSTSLSASARRSSSKRACSSKAQMPAGDLSSRLDEEAEKADKKPPPGEWRSLSAELLQSFYRMP